MRATNAHPKLTDGVWQAPFTDADGNPVLVAVVDGRRVGEMSETPETTRAEIRDRLWSKVDGEVQS